MANFIMSHTLHFRLYCTIVCQLLLGNTNFMLLKNQQFFRFKWYLMGVIYLHYFSDSLFCYGEYIKLHIMLRNRLYFIARHQKRPIWYALPKKCGKIWKTLLFKWYLMGVKHKMFLSYGQHFFPIVVLFQNL